MKRWVILGVLALLPLSTMAQLSVPANVRSVATGGRWHDGKRDGQYRVVVVDDGYEHVWSRVYIQWVARPQDRNDTELIVATTEATLPFPEGTTMLVATIHPVETNRLRVALAATPNSMGGHRASIDLIATTPGQLRVVDAPKR
jgi:hypothetical protein